MNTVWKFRGFAKNLSRDHSLGNYTTQTRHHLDRPPSLWLPFASQNLSSPFPSLALVLRGRQVETILAPLFGCYSATRRVSTPPGSKATAPVKGWLRITDAFLINPHPLELQRWPQKGRDPHTTSGSVSLRELSRDRCLVKREGPGAGNRKGNRERN